MRGPGPTGRGRTPGHLIRSCRRGPPRRRGRHRGPGRRVGPLQGDKGQRCVPLIGADWVEERCERLGGTAFRSFVIARSLGEADTYVEDALGQMEAGDLESAVLSARQAFDHAVDALLEGTGEFGSHQPKWRANRFKAAVPGVLTFDEYWAIETMQTYDNTDPRPWIKNVLALCQDIAMRVDVS